MGLEDNIRDIYSLDEQIQYVRERRNLNYLREKIITSETAGL